MPKKLLQPASHYAALPPKQRVFLDLYLLQGSKTFKNHALSASQAGYKFPAQEGLRLLKEASVLAALEERKAEIARNAAAVEDANAPSKSASPREVREFWTEVMRRGRYENNRIKASELLAKHHGMLIERVQTQVELHAVVVVPDKVEGATWEERAEKVREQQLAAAREREGKVLEAEPTR